MPCGSGEVGLPDGDRAGLIVSVRRVLQVHTRISGPSEGATSERTPLSLADLLCLALADRLELDALTVDRAWSGLDRAVLVR